MRYGSAARSRPTLTTYRPHKWCICSEGGRHAWGGTTRAIREDTLAAPNFLRQWISFNEVPCNLYLLKSHSVSESRSTKVDCARSCRPTIHFSTPIHVYIYSLLYICLLRLPLAVPTYEPRFFSLFIHSRYFHSASLSPLYSEVLHTTALVQRRS